jgi:UDP-N-acetylglucosamine 2-epimerase (non-hydrolysing)
MTKRVMVVFGTRPEAIKMAPLVRALRADDRFETLVCTTGQHREMLTQVLELFDIVPDVRLEVMTDQQTLAGLTARVLEGVSAVLDQHRPDIVLVHGDTTTTVASAMAAFYHRIPVGHVEAGLRTGDLSAPWPEEFNRRAAGVIAAHHFAPTAKARENLLAEGVRPEDISVTGNTVIDALLMVRDKIAGDAALKADFDARFSYLDGYDRVLLVTGHRRENFGQGFLDICKALARLAARPGLGIVYPVHLNPNVQRPVYELLEAFPNVHLEPPLEYRSFVYLLDRCHLVLTDSGGIQEEAPSFGKPVFVMRAVTERPEGVAAGTVRLVGASEQGIVEAVTGILDDPADFARMSSAVNPYGDGRAVEKILRKLTDEC